MILLGLSAVLMFHVTLYVFLKTVSYDPPPLNVILSTLQRDVRGILIFFKTYVQTYYYFRRNMTVWKIFSSFAKVQPHKTCLIFEDQTWSYREMERLANQVAGAFSQVGYKKGDVVALFMHNRPEYVCIWLGLSKLGVITALINTKLRLNSLAHCINIVPVKAIIFDKELSQATESAALLFNNGNCEFYCFEDTADLFISLPVKSLRKIIKEEPKRSLPQHRYEIGFEDELLYVYTSGTTGLPKAAVIRNARFLMICAFSKYLIDIQKEDILYNALPLYHTSGGIMFLTNSLILGNITVIRKRFSASQYWEDVTKHNVTICTHIGEICRFLLRQPVNDFERKHKVRSIIGNGLQTHIREEFKKRFRIPKIIEYFASTEGTAVMFNDTDKAGAVGFIPRTFSKISSVLIMRVDLQTEEPIRGKDGLCIMCKPGEPGVAIGKDKGNHPMFRFDGYSEKKETEKKIIRDCFKKGDRVFFSGDLVVMDKEGYVYFLDRMGDTFRWRGENVSTTEVENTISKILDFTPCAVYGVQVPGTEGRAGMIAIQSDVITNLKDFYNKLSDLLPTHAVPIFIRFCPNLDLTGTFKLKKSDFRNAGFSFDKISDPMFFLDPTKKEYVKLDEKLWKSITEQKLKF